MTSSSNGAKRYTLVLPTELYNEVQRVADAKHTTVVDIIRRFIKLGLLLVQVEGTPDAALLIREGDSEKQIVLL
jgi:hypothetical protein